MSLGRRRRVREVGRQAAAVGDLDLEAHALLALRTALGFGEEVVGAFVDERDGDAFGLLGAAPAASAAAVDVGLQAVVLAGVAQGVGGGVGGEHHRRVVVRLEYW